MGMSCPIIIGKKCDYEPLMRDCEHQINTNQCCPTTEQAKSVLDFGNRNSLVLTAMRVAQYISGKKQPA